MEARAIMDEDVNKIMGKGPSICARIGDRAENNLAKVLQRPIAVAAKRVGKSTVFDV